MKTFNWNRNLKWVIVTVLLTANLLVGARLYSQETPAPSPDTPYDKIALFTKVIEQIRQHYVDTKKTTYKELIYGALRGMLSSLDPHSQFMDPDNYKDMKDDTAGQFGGLGIVISVKDNILTIVAPMEDTPGFRAGLMSGDKILEIDGESTEGLPLQDAVKKLRGIPGTKVKIKILRPKTQVFKDLEIERAEINVPSVKDAQVLEDDIGYVRVLQFNEPTADDLQTSIDQLMNQGIKALILDLRNNPGGLLNSAVDVGQKFLRRGDMIVYTQGRDEKPQQIFRARGRHHFLDIPMVVLINGGSASASEIVAGALQDHRRAILIGEKSFGKGSVQSVLPLDDGSAIRLTTAKYYTPSKRVIHENGIEPDIVVPISSEDWRKLLLKRSRPEHAAPEEGEEDLSNVTDVQLDRAIAVLKGILLFMVENNDGVLLSQSPYSAANTP